MAIILRSIFLCLLFLSSVANASSSYLVVDIDKVVNNSRAYKEFKARWDVINNKYQKEIENYEKKIDVLDKDLSSNLHKFDESKLKESRNLIGKYENNVRQIMQQRTVILDKAMVDAFDVLRKNIAAVVQEYANEHKVNLILPSTQVIYHTSNLDVTQKVLENLDQRLGKINIEIGSNVNA